KTRVFNFNRRVPLLPFNDAGRSTLMRWGSSDTAAKIRDEFASDDDKCVTDPRVDAVEDDVLALRIVRDRLVDGDRPGRGGPHDCARADQFRDVRALDDFERYVDLGRDDVLIFVFGLA